MAAALTTGRPTFRVDLPPPTAQRLLTSAACARIALSEGGQDCAVMSSPYSVAPYSHAAAQRRQRSTWAAVGLLCACFAAGLVLGHVDGRNRLALGDAQALADRQIGLFAQAWSVLDREFYRPTPLDYRTMAYGAIRGMLASLSDPHTQFVEPVQHRLEDDRFKGGYGGIGVTLTMQDGIAILSEVYAGAPAARAGLRPGDVLSSVDGKAVSGLARDALELLLRGPVGSRVGLQVRRPGQDQPLTLALARERIETPSVSWRALQSGVGYIQITYFSGRSGEEFARAMQALRERGVRALVLDLRGNGGGLVQSAVEVLGPFLDSGIAFREVTRNGQEQRYALPLDSQKSTWPLAVLVDGGTASAAEIVAVALQECQRAVLVGTATFGKGSVQSLFTLSDGSSLHVTVAHWLSPAGRGIDGRGLEPDWIVPGEDGPQSDGTDLVLGRALQVLQQQLAEAIVSPQGEATVSPTGETNR